MAAVAQGPLPFDNSPPEERIAAEPDDAVIYFGVSLVLGIAARHLLTGTKVPYTIALLVLGIALGSLEFGTSHGLGKLGAGIRLWAKINPDLLLSVFLPALLFESSFAMEVHQIKRCMVQMLLLAGPGVIISTFFLGSALKLMFPYGWNWKTSLLLGGLLSATDPVAVVALLKELGASKKLSTIIEGESLMNDGPWGQVIRRPIAMKLPNSWFYLMGPWHRIYDLISLYEENVGDLLSNEEMKVS